MRGHASRRADAEPQAERARGEPGSRRASRRRRTVYPPAGLHPRGRTGVIRNHVKQALRAGKPQFGTLLNFGDPLVAEMMAAVGFDWLLADTEHGPIDLATLATMFATITRYPVAPLVRVHAIAEENFKRVLDAGAWGVLAPNVRTREERSEERRVGKECRSRWSPYH